MLDDFFAKHPKVKNGITFNSKVYIIGEYLLKRNISDFNLMGYDLLQRNVDCLKEGSVFFLIAQQPVLQGYNGIKTLCDYLILKKEVQREHFMPIDLLTKENIEFYYNK
jgi:LacI family transcriptional regulator